MGPAIGELFAAVAAQGVAVTGAWFTHHSRRPTDTFDFDVGVPVASPVLPNGPMRPATWPAMQVVRCEFVGDYTGLAGAWGRLHEWIRANGHEPAQDLWEVYLAGRKPVRTPRNGARSSTNRCLVERSAAGLKAALQ